MKGVWRRLQADETGLIVSSELVLVGTVAVLGMVVGLEAVSSAVIQELNDLSQAFGSINQSFNFRSIAKVGHARVSGSGFIDRADFCDCVAITQTDVFGQFGNSQIDGGGFVFGQSAVVNSGPNVEGQVLQSGPVIQGGPVVQERILSERVIDEVIVEPAPTRVLTPVCPDLEGEIIEERIIRRRVHPDCVSKPPIATASAHSWVV